MKGRGCEGEDEREMMKVRGCEGEDEKEREWMRRGKVRR